MSNILITGGCGFVGRQLASDLCIKHNVILVDDLSNKQSFIPKSGKFINGDISNEKLAKKVFKNIDYCIALASRKGAIGYVNRHPTEILTLNNNIYNSTFKNCVKFNVKKIIFISSSMVFEGSKRFPTPEKYIFETVVPLSPFGLSKYIGEIYCKNYYKEFGLKYVIIRPSNVYGIGEKPEKLVGDSHVIPDITKKIIKSNETIEILGNGKQTRCFIHVEDLSKAIIKCLSNKIVNTDFNVGGAKEFSINEIVDNIIKIISPKKKLKKKYVKSYSDDVKRQFMNCSKAKKNLKWKEDIKFKDGLKSMVEWLITNIK